VAWEEQLFAVLDELEQEAGARFAEERALEVAERARAEYRVVTLASRLAASVGREVLLVLQGPGALRGVLRRTGDGWCLLEASTGHDWVVMLPAVVAVRGASPRSLPEAAWGVAGRLGPGTALRRLADEGERCVVHLVDGSSYDGRLDRVGADLVELVPDGGGDAVLLASAAVAAVQDAR